MTVLSKRKTRLSVELPTEVRSISRRRAPSGRVTTASIYRPLVADFQLWGVELRLKGTQKKYPITYDQIFNRAVLIEAERLRAERKTRRKAKAA